MNTISRFQDIRYGYKPKLPEILNMPASDIEVFEFDEGSQFEEKKEIAEFFPNMVNQNSVKFKKGKNENASRKRKIGVILSGGQAPGGHNVISGIYDAMKEANPDSELLGFLHGPKGLIRGRYDILDQQKIDSHRNTGGFDLIGSGRTKIETAEQFATVIENVKKIGLDAVVIIGGDDSNTNAAFLAEKFKEADLKTQVIGIPKTIDGDMKNKFIETSFGFDTASKIYSNLIGNLARDAISATKYWNFVKLMGRSASHIALECALQVHPNVTLIGEEIAAKNLTLQEIVDKIALVIAKRAEKNMNFGIVLIPEGIIEFIPETKALIHELNGNWPEYEKVQSSFTSLDEKKEWLKTKLSESVFKTLCSLPETIAEQFLGLRDPHGNIEVSRIETEKVFILMINRALKKMHDEGKYDAKFAPISFFYGYEGRSAFPSNFDANYCYALGKTAFHLITNGKTGYIASIKNLAKDCEEWIPGGVPLTRMMAIENRVGKLKPVIEKTLVDLNGKPFAEFAKNRESWEMAGEYKYPGPVQYFGPEELQDSITLTLKLESEEKA